MFARKTCFLLIIFLIIATLAFAKPAPDAEADKKARERRLKQFNKIISTPILSAPDVSKCIKGRTYLVTHILYMCFHYENGAIRTLVPMACATSNGPNHKRVNLYHNFKDHLFAYRCLREDNVFKYKPITCLYLKKEIAPGKTIRVDNVEFTCIQNAEGNMSLIQKRYLHTLCPVGGQKDCPGLSRAIIHSKYGTGTKVKINVTQNILVQ